MSTVLGSFYLVVGHVDFFHHGEDGSINDFWVLESFNTVELARFSSLSMFYNAPQRLCK